MYDLEYFRPWYYFILVAIGFTLLIFQTLILKYTVRNVLFTISKLLLLSISFRASRFFTFPEIPGADTHFHLRLSQSILNSGYVPTNEIYSQYIYTPFWHIYDVVQSLMFNLDIGSILFIFASIAIVAITFLTYVIGEELFDFRVGLITAIFVNMADMIFVRTLTNINTSLLVMIYFLVLILCFFHRERVFFGIAISMVLCMFWTHQLSVFAVWLAIIGFYLCLLAYKRGFFTWLNSALHNNNRVLPYPNTPFTVFTVIYMIFFWTMMRPESSESSFFAGMTRRLKGSLDRMINEYLSSGDLQTSVYEDLFTSIDILDALLYNLGYAILVCLALVGMIFVMKKISDQKKMGMLLSAGILFVVIYPGTFIGLNQLFIPHRFLSILELVFIPFSAFSLLMFFRSCHSRGMNIVFSGFVLLLLFLLITTPYVNRNDPLYAQGEVHRTEMMYAELVGISWGQLHSPNNRITVDPYISRGGLSTTDIGNINAEFVDSYSSNANNHLINIRQYIINDPCLRIGGTFGKVHQEDYSELLGTIQATRSLSYDNGKSYVYLI